MSEREGRAAGAPALELETAHGAGAIAVVRLRGAGARARLATLAPVGAELAVGELRLVRLVEAGELVDEALVAVRGPDDFELHLHGGPAVLDALARALGVPVAAPERGASVESRALAAAASASSDVAARVLVDQARGALRRDLARLAAAAPGPWRAGLAELVERGRAFQRLAAPPRVVLAGPTNAGKSTLYNVLAGRTHALVSDEPGTTRDLLRQRVPLGRFAMLLVDTAGEREGASGIEHAGQELARAAREGADLVLWLSPRDAPAPPPTVAAALRVVVSRADRAPASGSAAQAIDAGAPAISATADPAHARRAIAELVTRTLGLDERRWPPRAAVPFEPELRETLASWSAAPELVARDRRHVALARALGSRTSAWWD